jgi:hypothetical protein
MTDGELVAKRLAFIETCLREPRQLARPEVLATDIREQRFVEHSGDKPNVVRDSSSG